MLKIVKRVEAATATGFSIALICFLYMGVTQGFGSSVAWGVLIWYTFIGFLIGIVGTVKKHPVFGFHMIFLRGALVAGILDLAVGLMAEPEFLHIFNFLPYQLFLAMLTEGIVVGVIIDGVATKIGGEGKDLLNKK